MQQSCSKGIQAVDLDVENDFEDFAFCNFLHLSNVLIPFKVKRNNITTHLTVKVNDLINNRNT